MSEMGENPDPILRWDESRDGPLSETTMRRKLERLGFRASRWTYSPGTYFPEHMHECEKIDGVLSGCLRIVLEARPYDLRAGDCISIPAGALHTAEVIGFGIRAKSGCDAEIP